VKGGTGIPVLLNHDGVIWTSSALRGVRDLGVGPEGSHLWCWSGEDSWGHCQHGGGNWVGKHAEVCTEYGGMSVLVVFDVGTVEEVAER